MEEDVDYNKEPVYYCTRCLSLYIRNIGDLDYCEKCGSTSIQETQIEDWEEKYKNKFNKSFLEN